MKIYSVGGAVRDELLGLPVKDRDYVVVGATPEEMVKQGYKPVGKDFPVFLHPQTKQEYALARTERKTAPGYKGFVFHTAPDVTLEQDLVRRDFTINAIAKDEAGKLIDPFGGAADLKSGVLKHVSDAFAEDPVRILRAARFAARFGFAIAPETLLLMHRMVEKGETDALVPERVWQEFARGLMEKTPLRMLAILIECGALARIAPELDAHLESENAPYPSLAALDAVAQANAPLEVRFAVLLRGLDPLAVESLCSRLKVPGECRDLALLAARHGNAIADALNLDARTLLELFDATDVWRRPERFGLLMDAALIGEADAHAHATRSSLERALKAALSLDAGAIAKLATDPEQIRLNINAARLDAIRRALKGGSRHAGT
jgi:tRNA nucleotidyltransferase (CCA-adding enzyme)